MYIFICVSIFLYNAYSVEGENVTDSVVSNKLDIADALVSILINGAKHESKRIRELKDKLMKIDSYVVDAKKYAELLVDVAKRNNLTHTNFYDALIEEDHFSFIKNSKNLYLKLKEKMNSDDMFSILAKNGNPNIKKSARRMVMGTPNPHFKKYKDKHVADAVENYLAEYPTDVHEHDFHNIRSSLFWDSKVELEDRYMHSRLNARRIYRGERTTVRYYPFMVSVEVMGAFWCGGSLVGKDLVITSAACLQLVHNNRFYRENPRVLVVRVGSNHSKVGGEPIEALEVFFHPSYNPKTLENNIALVRMQRQVTLSHHRVPKLIEIAKSEQGLPFTALVMLLGWGVSKISGKIPMEPKYLQRKFLPVYPNTACKEIYGEKFDPRTMFCAGTVSTGEGACSHDAGGPAILAGKLVGIISYGPSVCGLPDAPTVLTMVGAYSDWIETIAESMPGYYRNSHKTTSTTEDPLFDYFAKLGVKHFRASEDVRSNLMQPPNSQKKDVLSDNLVQRSENKIEALTTADPKENIEQFTNMYIRNITQTRNPIETNYDKIEKDNEQYQRYLLMMKRNNITWTTTKKPLEANTDYLDKYEMIFETKITRTSPRKRVTPLRSDPSPLKVNIELIANADPQDLPTTDAAEEDALKFINNLFLRADSSKEGSNTRYSEQLKPEPDKNIQTDTQLDFITLKNFVDFASNKSIKTNAQPALIPEEDFDSHTPYLLPTGVINTDTQVDLNQVENIETNTQANAEYVVTSTQKNINLIDNFETFLQRELEALQQTIKEQGRKTTKKSLPHLVFLNPKNLKNKKTDTKRGFNKKGRKRKRIANIGMRKVTIY